MEDLPNRRTALKALHDGREVWAALILLKTLYLCNRCKEGIGIGAEAVVTRYAARLGGVRTDHFFYHRPCFAETLLPRLTSVKRIPPREASMSRVNRTLRRRRYRHKRRQS